jgi:hypothetical protein
MYQGVESGTHMYRYICMKESSGSVPHSYKPHVANCINVVKEVYHHINHITFKHPTEESKSNILVTRSSRGRCAQNLHDERGLHDTHRTRILRVTFASHTPDSRRIHAGCARHIRESDANVARNKGCYFWTPMNQQNYVNIALTM